MENWVVDACPDANGFWTIRIADGTPSGNTSLQPIATVFSYQNAEMIIKSNNYLKIDHL